jgi:hypothetical protein
MRTLIFCMIYYMLLYVCLTWWITLKLFVKLTLHNDDRFWLREFQNTELLLLWNRHFCLQRCLAAVNKNTFE